jgi:hypothetical protein
MLKGSPFAALALDVDRPARMTILNPVTRMPVRNRDTNENCWIDFLSTSSKPARQLERELSDRIIKLRGRRLSAEEIEDHATERLARLATGWSLAGLDGTPINVPFSEGAARELFELPELAWLREQCLEHLNDVGNWGKSLSTSSENSPNISSASAPEPTTEAASANT